MIFTKQIRILFLGPLIICIILIFFTAFYPWFLEVYDDVDELSAIDLQTDTIPLSYTLNCFVNVSNMDEGSYQIYTDNSQYYIVQDNLLLCTMEQHQSQKMPSFISAAVTSYTNLLRNSLSNTLTSDNSKIVQITLSIAGIELVLIIAVINYYARSLAHIVAAPIDELTQSLRNIDQNNIDEYFSERLQGESSKLIPDEMLLLLRSVYDFIGIVKIANEAFIQGNDGQAIIGYAVANQFYLENGNKLGAGVIQNNMGVIHIRNRRFQEAINCFKEAIICIEREWAKYKKKYQSVGIMEDELIIDQEYQNLSKLVFNRCFNLCEALSEFLLSEILELQELLFSHSTQRKSVVSMESMLYAQVESADHATRSKAISVFNPLHDEEQQGIEKIIKIKGNARRNVQDLSKLNDIMFTIRSQFLGTHDFQNNVIIHNIDNVTEKEIQFLIAQLWKDTIKTYEYCQEIMQFHLNKKQQKKLYITLKLIIGYLQSGQMKKSEELVKIAQEQYYQLERKNDDDELGHISFLAQKLYLYTGLVLYKQNQKIEAARQLINSLCIDGKFSSRDRMQALVMLKAIFQHFEKPLIQLNEFLIQYQPIAKDWIFILEASKIMKRDLAIIRACKTFHHIVTNIISPNDRVSYGILKEDYYEFIPLVGKVDNSAYIDKIFQYFPKPSGHCNYELINSIAKKYQSHPNTIQIGNDKYLTKDGIAFMRYKKIIVFGCWQPYNTNIDEELIIISFSDQKVKQENVYNESEWNKVLNKYQQLQTELNDSNYFLEQIL